MMNRARAARYVAAMAIGAALLAGCSDDEETSTSSTPQATYAWIQANVFDARCTGCHGASGGGAELSLTAANVTASPSSIISRASTEVLSLNRIEPRSADTSYLIQKVEGTAAVGARMPLTGSVLSSATIQAMRDWVNAGAALQ